MLVRPTRACHASTVRDRARPVKPPRGDTKPDRPPGPAARNAQYGDRVDENWSELERAYSPSTCVEDLDALLRAYRFTSEQVRARLSWSTHAYGQHPEQQLDVFPAGPGAPAHVFVHGGYWQELSRADASFPAEGFVATGITYVAVGYGLAPAFTLDQIVEQVRAALAWVHRNATRLGIDPARIVVSGSSAGAHLAAMAALTDWPARGRPAGLVRALVLLSGIFDLAPLVDTYINDAVGMDRTTAARNSPLRLLDTVSPVAPVPALIGWGEHETDAFKQQSEQFAQRWEQRAGPVIRVEATGRNHFDVVHDLADRATPLGAEVAHLHRLVGAG